MAGLILDAGALIGLERRSSRVHAALSEADDAGLVVTSDPDDLRALDPSLVLFVL